jgi:hypothetical protein
LENQARIVSRFQARRKYRASRRSGATRPGTTTVEAVFAVRLGRLFAFVVVRSEVAMSIFSYRKHLRFLSQAQRRRWWDQKKRLTPRVVVGSAYVPPNVTREFAYVKVG